MIALGSGQLTFSRRPASFRPVPMAVLGLLLILAATLLMLPGSHPALQDREAILAGSSIAHPAGTDALGRDRLLRCAGALLLGLGGASLAAGVTTCLAALVGVLAAFSRPSVRFLLLLLSDVFLTLPWLFLLMIVRAGLPLSTTPLYATLTTFALLALLGWPACARAVYRGARRLEHSTWLLQGRAAGLRPAQLIRLHLLPHLLPLLLPQLLVCIPAFLAAESNLGSLGLGVPEPWPSWGGMLAELSSSALLARSPWMYLPIGLLVAVLLLLEAMISAPEKSRSVQARHVLADNREKTPAEDKSCPARFAFRS